MNVVSKSLSNIHFIHKQQGLKRVCDVLLQKVWNVNILNDTLNNLDFPESRNLFML